jgi:hypothetical protein
MYYVISFKHKSNDFLEINNFLADFGHCHDYHESKDAKTHFSDPPTHRPVTRVWYVSGVLFTFLISALDPQMNFDTRDGNLKNV